VVTGALAVMRSFFRNPGDDTPALGNTELVARLLATADRTDRRGEGRGDYSDSDTYGHGLLDLDAATRPAGMLMASTADGRRVAAESTALEIPRGAFGDAVSRQLRAVPLVLFDALDSPFFFTADQLVHAPAPAAAGAELAAAEAAATADAMLLRAGDGQGRRWWFAPKYNSGAGLDGGFGRGFGVFGDGFGDGDGFGGDGAVRAGRAGFAGGGFGGGRHGLGGGGFGDGDGVAAPAFLAPHAFAAPYFSLVRHGFGGGFSAAAGRGRFGLAVMRGAAVADGGADDWRRGSAVAFNFAARVIASGRGALRLQAGLVREAEGFLGARGRGAFGAARGETLFAGAGLAWRAGRHWRAQAAGYVGQTRTGPDGAPGFLRGVSGLRSSAFSVGLARASALRRGDWLGLRLSQPLRAESGRARLRLATARSRYGVVRYDDIAVDLQPRARALEAEIAWRAPPSAIAGGDLSLGVQLTRHPGHNPDAPTQRFVWLRFGKEF